MRLAALLLLAAVIGFAVGRFTAPEAGGLRGQRPPPPAVAEPREPAPVASAPVDSTPEARPATESTAQPSGPREAGDQGERSDDGLGVIEVDFEGFDGEREAWVGWRRLRGEYDTWEESPEAGPARFEQAPGLYDVWWLGRDGRRRGTRAAVEAGKRTCIRASEYASAGPVPEGLGILEIEVAATWGGGLGCVVRVLGRGEEEGIVTNGRGHGSMTVFPGSYGLEIGDHREEVTVAEGRVTSRRIAHREEGDVVLDSTDLQSLFAVARPGRDLDVTEIWSGDVQGAWRRGFVYLAEGEYDLVRVNRRFDKLGVPIGRAVVHAGRTTLVQPRIPGGGVSVRVTWPEVGISANAGVFIRRIVDGVVSEGMITEQGADNLHDVRLNVALAPGRYVVGASAPYCENQQVEVDVGASMVDLAFDLVQQR